MSVWSHTGRPRPVPRHLRRAFDYPLRHCRDSVVVTTLPVKT